MKKLLLLSAILGLSPCLRADLWWDPAPPATGPTLWFGATFDDPAAEIVDLTLSVAGSYYASASGSYGSVHADAYAPNITDSDVLIRAELDSSVDDYDAAIETYVNETSPPTTPGTPTITAQTATTVSLVWSEASDNVGVAGYEIEANQTSVASSWGPSATVAILQPGILYSLRVRAFDAAGNHSDWSATVSVTLTAIPPGIAAQPSSLVVGAGQPAVFNVITSGEPVNLQWQKNGTNIGGATTSSFIVADAQAADAGDYSVVVSNIAGSVTSTAANLTVTPVLPTIDLWPVGQTFYAGQPEAIVVATQVHGTEPVSYQWRKDGVSISGATTASFTITNPQASNAGSYTVMLSNSVGSVISSAAALVVEAAPVRLALQYWQPNDYPNYPIYGWADVWVEGHWVHWPDQYDENGELTDPEHDEWVDGQYESQWTQIDVDVDGLHGPTWATSTGTFDIANLTSNYRAGLPARGFCAYSYSLNQNVAMRAWAQAPAANCNSFNVRVYNPAGTLISNSSVSAGTGLDLSSAMTDYGIWCVEVAYSGATGTSAVSGSAYYFIRVGIALNSHVIGFAPISDRNSGDASFPLGASASSGLPVSFAVVSGPLALSAGQATILGYGGMTVRASQSGGFINGTVWSGAPAVERSFTAAGATQTLTFPAIADRVYGDPPISLQATASSALPVTYALSGPASVANGSLTVEGVGSISVTATQPGNNIYLPAASITRVFTVVKAAQTISFGALSNRTLGELPINLVATSSSGLPVKFIVDSGPATIVGGTATITGSGAVSITASQPGNDNYLGATAVTRQFTVLADTTAPTSPTGLTASEVAARSLKLTWTPSTDNIGVVRYEIFRDGALVRSIGGTTVSLGTLAPQTGYQFGIRACDAAGNVSATTQITVSTSAGTNVDDGDGVPDAVERLLGTDPNAGGTADTTESMQLKVHRPNP